MPRDNARKVLENPQASREEICHAIMSLSMDLQYLRNSMGTNPAQETRQDVKESQELLEQLRARLADCTG